MPAEPRPPRMVRNDRTLLEDDHEGQQIERERNVQNSGTDATSVEMWAVTAIRRPDGTAASPIQIAVSRQVGAAAVDGLAGCVVVASGSRLGERSISTPQAATSSDQKIVADRPEPASAGQAG